MKYFYIYDNKEIYFQSNGKRTFSDIIKGSITRKGYDINKFIEENDKNNLEKCRICKTHYPPVYIDCYSDEFGKIIIKGFKPLKDKIYCYGLNKECPGRKLNPNSVEFISSVLLLSKEEALKYIKENNTSCFYKENWDNEEDYINYQKRDIGYFKKKYKEKAEEEYEKYKNKISYSNSKQGYIDKYGKEKGEAIFKEISTKKDSMSYKFFLKKNSYDYEKASIEYEKRKESVLINLDFFINKFNDIEIGIEEFEKHKINISNTMKKYHSTLTKEERVKKHSIYTLLNKIEDLEERKEIYNNWLKKVTVPITRASKESLLVFNEVIDFLKSININDIYIGKDDNKEYFIRDDDYIFFYDFTILSKKIIIEYNGVAFHPKLENIETFKPIGTKLTPTELYNKQKYKIDLAKSSGFKVLEIWSDDEYKVQKCINFIKNNI